MTSLLRTGILLLFLCQSVYAQEGKDKWIEKRVTADGDKVFVRKSETTGLYDVRIEADLPGTINKLFTVLKELDKFPSWAYGVKEARLVTWKGNNGLIYYAEYNVPWPLSNRDEYAEVKFSQDSTKHTARIVSVTLKDYAPEKKGVIRLRTGKGVWDVVTTGPDKIHMTYVLQIDPGGSVPAWIVNLFATKAPSETFKRLRKVLAEK